MAVICCATPSELYLEETRSTLQFASRAKLVKTKPQVNEVLDDSSLIKRLQRELAETRKLVQGKEHQQHMQHLQQAAQNAAREAEIKLCRLKACFLRGGFLPSIMVGDNSLNRNNAKQKKRRHSDVSSGCVMKESVMQMTPKHSITKVSKTLSTGYVCDDLIPGKENGKAGSQSAEAELLKDALHAKGQKTQGLNHEVSTLLSKLEKAKQELASAYDQNLRLQSMNEAAEAKNKTLEAAKEFMQAEFDNIINERNEYQKQSEAHFQSYMEAKDIEIKNIMEELLTVREEKKAAESNLKQAVADIDESRNCALQKENELAKTKKENEDLLHQIAQIQAINNSITADHDNSVKMLEAERIEKNERISLMENQINSLVKENESMIQKVKRLETQLIQAESHTEEKSKNLVILEDQLDRIKYAHKTLTEDVLELKRKKEYSEAELKRTIRELDEEKIVLAESKVTLDFELKRATEDNENIRIKLEELKEETDNKIHQIQNQLQESEALVAHSSHEMIRLKEDLDASYIKNKALIQEYSELKAKSDSDKVQFQDVVKTLKEEKMKIIEAKMEVEEQKNASAENLNHITARMAQQVEELEAELLQSAAKAEEKSRQMSETEAGLERVTSSNKLLLEENIDLKEKKEYLEAKLEHSVKILEEEKLALSESKAKIEYELKCVTEEYHSTCVQLEEHKVKSGHEIDHIQSQLQEYEALVAENRNENARIKEDLAQSLLKYETLLQECSDLRVSKESSEGQFQDALSSLEAEKTELNEGKKQLEEQLKSTLESFQRVTLQLQCTEEASKVEIEAIQLKLLESNALVEENRNLAANLRKELAQIAAKHEVLLEENSHFRNNIQCLTDEMDRSISRLEAERRVLQERIFHNEEELNAFVGEKARMAQQVEELEAELLQNGAKDEEKSRKLDETEVELERVTSANKLLLEEVLDLKEKKGLMEAKLEHSIKILEEEKLALSESKAKIEYELKCVTEEYHSTCVQLEEHKVKSGHEIDHIQSQLQEYEALVAENRNENARIKEDLAQSLLKYEMLLQECSDLRVSKESSEGQFHDTLSSLEAEKTELNEGKKQLEEQLKSTLESFQRVTLQLQCTEEASKVEIEAIQSKLLESNALVEENRNLAANLRKELAQVAAKHEVLLEENSHFRNNIQCLTDEMNLSIKRLEAENLILQEKKSHFENQLNSSMSEKLGHMQRIEHLETLLLQSRASAEKSSKYIIRIEGDLSRARSEIVSLIEKNESLLQMADSTSRYESTISRLEMKNKSLLEANCLLESRISSVGDQSNEIVLKLEHQISVLNQELVESRQKVEDLLEKATYTQSLVGNLNQTIAATNSEKLALQQEKKELHDYVRLLKADARAARQATTESDIVVRELKDRVMDLESLLSKAKLESQSTVEQVNRHYAELKQKYCAIDGELNLLTSKYNQAKVELQQAHSREGTMNKENENIVDCSEVHMLKKEVSRLNEQIQLRDCRIKKLNAVKMTKEQCTALKRMKVILQG